MSQPPRLPINQAHVVQQFTRRSPLDAAQFLYGEITQRMLQRLSYIRITPKDILDAGCGAGHALDPLRARYPELNYTGLDACGALLDVARARYISKPGFWHKLRNKPTPALHFVQGDLADNDLPELSQDLIWSNLALHWHPEPHRVLVEWRRTLKSEALVMFSCFGPGTFRELRTAIESADLSTNTMDFVDMHDFGDLMLRTGFSDPVMDQEIITLTYRTAEKLLEDIHCLGGNPRIDRKPGLSGRAWRERLIRSLERQRHADGTIHLSLEVAYGHAWRATVRRDPSGDLPVPTFKRSKALNPDAPPPRVRPRKSGE